MKKKLDFKMLPQPPVIFSNPCCIDNISHLVDYRDNKSNIILDLNVYLPSKGRNLQRELYWTLEQKQKFIISVLQDRPLLPLSINYKCDKGIYEVIDGKQRLSCLISYYKGEFPIIVNNEEYYYQDLEKYTSLKIKLFDFHAYQHFEHERDLKTILSDEDKIKWFLYINNTATPQQDSYISDLENLL